MNQELEYPHVCILQVNFSIHQKNEDGTTFPSAVSGGSGQISITGDTYSKCLDNVRQWLKSRDIKVSEKP